MSKDIIQINYDRFCLRTSMLILLSVFSIILITLTAFNVTLLQSSDLHGITFVTVFFVTFWTVITGLYTQNRIRNNRTNKFRYIISAIVGAALGFIMVVLSSVYLFVISNIFRIDALAPIWISCLLSLFSAVAVYIATKSIFNLNQSRYLSLTVITYLVGFCSSLILTRNQDWWYTSVCALGMPSNPNFEYYNITLILGGLMLMAFSFYLLPQLKILVQEHLLGRMQFYILAALYYTQALVIALVGVFPYGISDYTNKVHMFLAQFTFYIIAAIILFAVWFFNKFPKEFIRSNYILVLFGAILFYIANYTVSSLFTLAEMLNVVVIIVWVNLFLKTIQKLSNANNLYL